MEWVVDDQIINITLVSLTEVGHLKVPTGEEEVAIITPDQRTSKWGQLSLRKETKSTMEA
jgi:hypothetical protein